jgi:hypothetical protein
MNQCYVEKAFICLNCESKINEYDMHQTLANQLNAELTQMFRETYSCTVLIKTEIKEEIYDNEDHDGYEEQYDNAYVDDYDEHDDYEIDDNYYDFLDHQLQKPKIAKSAPSTSKMTVKKASSREPAFKRPYTKRSSNQNRSQTAQKNAELVAGKKFTEFEGVKYFQCETCGKHIKGNGAFVHHEAMHTEDRNFKCEVSSFKRL